MEHASEKCDCRPGRWAAALAVGLFVAAVPAVRASRLMQAWGADRFSQFGTAISGAGDFNADGYDDFLIGSPYLTFQSGPGFATLYFGGPPGTDFTGLRFSGTDPAGRFGTTVARAGDLDADGFSDILIASATGEVRVFRGSAVPDTIPDLLLAARGGGFGTTLASAGGWNGDGYDDFLVGAPSDSTLGPRRGRVYVFFGGAALDAIPDRVLEGASDGDRFGSAIAGGLDLNGDGFDDIAVGAPYASGAAGAECGEVRVFFGGPANADAAADLVLSGAHAGGRFGSALALLADFTGDGAADLAVGAPTALVQGRVFVFAGGAALDGVPDWEVAGSPTRNSFGYALAAGDDVNRDHVSDLLVNSVLSAPSLYLGGSPPDTLPDSPLIVPPAGFGSSAIAGGFDVNGDGYQDWLFGRLGSGQFSGAFVGLFTAHGDLQLIAPNGGFDQTLLGGAPFEVQWAGAEPAALEYTRDGSSWQTLASGVGGADLNSHPVTIPLGRALRTARMRVSAVNDTIVDLGDGRFSVQDPVQAVCLGTTPAASGTGVTWSADWLGFPSAERRYRLFRRDGNGPESQIGPDTLDTEGFLDPTGAADSRYRLVALTPSGPAVLDSVGVGSASCDSVHLEMPNGGEALFLANFLNVTWTGTRPVDLLLSRDDGLTWQTFAIGQSPPSATITGTAPASALARVRVQLRGVGGAVWDDSDAPFSIRTDVQLVRFEASHRVEGGVALSWETDPPASLTSFLGFRLCRAATAPQAPCAAIGPWPNPGTTYEDPGGTDQSVYALWAVLNDYTEIRLGEARVGGGGGGGGGGDSDRVVFGPSPAHAKDEVVLRMGSPATSSGSASDVEVSLYDATGRQLAILGRDLGAGGTVSLRWVPARLGLKAGLYWLRVSSASAKLDRRTRFVVL